MKDAYLVNGVLHLIISQKEALALSHYLSHEWISYEDSILIDAVRKLAKFASTFPLEDNDIKPTNEVNNDMA